MDRTTFADVELTLDWQSAIARHRDRLLASKVSFWRDVLPGSLGERLGSAPAGDEAREAFAPGQIVPACSPANLRRIPASAFRRRVGGRVIDPRPGRFYPRALAHEALGTFAADMAPMRVVEARGESLVVDLNHPLCRYPLEVGARVTAVLAEREERGGNANDIADLVTRGGPGMQAPADSAFTDYFADYPFSRADAADDALFYREPRIVQHIDRTAAAQVTAIYGRLLPPGARVLDLMASWVSHLPPERTDLSVAGLGMNAEELARNRVLADRVVHDLNADPRLPFADGEFDAVVCTVSFEYLTRPLEVFADAARVLRRGGVFANALSERCFPPKAITLWGELHPFERLGLALECYRRTGLFADLNTETIRGLPRPTDDKYAATLAFADPIYAAWGTRA